MVAPIERLVKTKLRGICNYLERNANGRAYICRLLLKVVAFVANGTQADTAALLQKFCSKHIKTQNQIAAQSHEESVVKNVISAFNDLDQCDHARRRQYLQLVVGQHKLSTLKKMGMKVGEDAYNWSDTYLEESGRVRGIIAGPRVGHAPISALAKASAVNIWMKHGKPTPYGRPETLALDCKRSDVINEIVSLGVCGGEG